MDFNEGIGLLAVEDLEQLGMGEAKGDDLAVDPIYLEQ